MKLATIILEQRLGPQTTQSGCLKRPWRSLLVAVAAAALSAGAALATPQGSQPVGHFVPIATYEVSGDVAEIVAVTANGRVLVYTDSESQQVGFVNISDPANPTELGIIPVGGSPTSVAIARGRWVLVTVHGVDEEQMDHLAIFDLLNLAAPVLHLLGGQPDSIAVSPNGRYAAIAIENERNEDINDGEMPQEPPGFLTIVDLVGAPADWTLRNVSLTNYSDRFPTDPEPEFVDINAANHAAVTLQENNHIVLVDLVSGTVLGDFSAGTVTHVADLVDDGSIAFVDTLVARREPDAIGWTPGGNLVTANEGDYDLDLAEGQFVGGRGFTIFSPSGEVLFDVGADLELQVAAAGLYNDGRSDNKGTEPEGIEIATYANHTYLFVGMERAAPGAVAVYRLSRNEAAPEFVQILTTGSRPEGLLAIPQRSLFVTANEGDGTISIFQGRPGNPVPLP